MVAGLYLTRMTWRDDIPPYSRKSSTLEIMLHPDRFATPRHLGTIRILNAMGMLLLAAAVATIIADIAGQV